MDEVARRTRVLQTGYPKREHFGVCVEGTSGSRNYNVAMPAHASQRLVGCYHSSSSSGQFKV